MKFRREGPVGPGTSLPGDRLPSFCDQVPCRSSLGPPTLPPVRSPADECSRVLLSVLSDPVLDGLGSVKGDQVDCVDPRVLHYRSVFSFSLNFGG